MDPSSCASARAPKHAMASHFLRSLARARRTASFALRSRRIRRAAYVAMAHSAGSSRAWSRALLRRLRLRRRHGAGGRVAAGRQVDRLRQLVPGGAGMGACQLLEEAADYVRCLAAQVWIMKAVVDSISS